MTGNDWNHQFIDVNGIRMHYVRSGRKGAPPLLLLHGWPEFWYTYHKIIPALSAHYDVIAPDLRGFGQTDNRRAQHSQATVSKITRTTCWR